MGDTMFQRLGSEPVLREIIDEFIDRAFEDPMIGFIFQRADRARIKQFEYQLAAAFLGAPVKYAGRALAEAHRPHRIMGGQFARRRELLRQVLVEHEVPEDIVTAWMAHTDSLRPLITHDHGSECIG